MNDELDLDNIKKLGLKNYLNPLIMFIKQNKKQDN